jgi:acyl-CoA thioester hydrolase
MDSGTKCASLLAGYPVQVVLPVQWGDQDALGHVNNTVPFRWFESARIAYNQRIGLLDLFEAERIGSILAATACDFLRQITFPDTVHVGIRAVRIGRTSVGMEHAVVSERQGAVVAQGTSTIVVMDYRTNKPHPVPTSIRQAMETLERRAFN